MEKLLKKRSQFKAVLHAVFYGEISFYELYRVKNKKVSLLDRIKLLNKGRDLLKYFLMALGLIIIAIYTFWGGSYLGSGRLFDATALLSLSAKLAFVFNLVINFTSVVYFLFLTNDVKYMLALPIDGGQIIKAKFLQVAYNTVPFDFITLFMLMAGHAYGSKAAVATYILHFVVVTLAIIGSKSLLCLIAFALVNFTKFFRDRDRFLSVSSTVLLIFSCFIGVVSQALFRMNDPEMLLARLSGAGALGTGTIFVFLLSAITDIFFVPSYFSRMIYGTSLLQTIGGLLLSAVIVTAMAFALYYLAKGRYLSILNNQTSSARKQILTISQLQKKFKRRSPLRSYGYVDANIVKREPQLNLMYVLTPLIMPFYLLLVVAVSLFFAFKHIAGSYGLSESFKKMGQMLDSFRVYMSLHFTWDSIELLAVTAGIICFLAFFAMSSSSTGEFLRDGINFKFYQSLPLKMSTVIWVKWQRSFVYNYLIFILMVVIPLIIIHVHLLASLLLVLTILLFFTLYNSLSIIFGALYVDFSISDQMLIAKKSKGFVRMLINLATTFISLCIPALILYIALDKEILTAVEQLGFGTFAVKLPTLAYILAYLVLANIFSLAVLFIPIPRYLEKKE